MYDKKKYVVGIIVIIILIGTTFVLPQKKSIIRAESGNDDEYQLLGSYEPQDFGDIIITAQHTGGGLGPAGTLSDTVFVSVSNSSGNYVISVCGYLNSSNTDKIIRTDVERNESVLIGTIGGTSRRNAGAVYHESRHCIYIFGGYTNSKQSSVFEFNLSNLTGSSLGNILPENLESFNVGFTYNEICYLPAPGTTGVGDNGIDKVLAYNPSNNTAWYILDGLPFSNNAVRSTGCYDTDEDTFYLFGNVIIGGNVDKQIVAYCPVNNTAWLVCDYWGAHNAAYNTVNKTFMCGPAQTGAGAFPCNTSYWNMTAFSSTQITANNTIPNQQNMMRVAFLNGSFYLLPLTENLNISKVDFGYQSEDASEFEILGLDGYYKNISWTGTAGTTVWSNATAEGGTLELNMSINSSDNVTGIKVYCGDIDASMLAGNITLYVSRDNTTYAVPDDNAGVFTDGGSNISINTSTWPAGAGDNPFTVPDSGLTDTNTSIFMRFTLGLGSSDGTFSQSDWKIYVGCYT